MTGLEILHAASLGLNIAVILLVIRAWWGDEAPGDPQRQAIRERIEAARLTPHRVWIECDGPEGLHGGHGRQWKVMRQSSLGPPEYVQGFLYVPCYEEHPRQAAIEYVKQHRRWLRWGNLKIEMDGE